MRETTLSALLRQVKAGETVTITDRGRPSARIVPVTEIEVGDRFAELARFGACWRLW
jgi:prevent-host-death family protein